MSVSSKKLIDCSACSGMGATLVKKAGKASIKKCSICGGKGKVAKPEPKKVVMKKSTKSTKSGKKIKAVAVRKPKLERAPKVESAARGITVVSRDLETGEDVSAKMTPEQREAKETIEERAAFFGCPGKVNAVRKGPVITLYEFQPAKTTRIKRLISDAGFTPIERDTLYRPVHRPLAEARRPAVLSK